MQPTYFEQSSHLDGTMPMLTRDIRREVRHAMRRVQLEERREKKNRSMMHLMLKFSNLARNYSINMLTMRTQIVVKF